MNRPFLFTICIIAMVGFRLTACESCSCGMGGTFLGIEPNYSKQLIGIRHQFDYFSGEQYSIVSEEIIKEERSIHSSELWGRYMPHERWMLQLHLPFHFYRSRINKQWIQEERGLGDVRLQALFTAIEAGQNRSKWNHMLQIGNYIKLPSGKHRLNEPGNWMPGSGSLDIGLLGLYTLRDSKKGLQLQANYQLNGADAAQFRNGNALNLAIRFFYHFQGEKSDWICYAGPGMEQNAMNQYQGIRQTSSGGIQYPFFVGGNWYSKHFSVNAGAQFPIYQYQHSGLDSKCRLQLGLNYIF